MACETESAALATANENLLAATVEKATADGIAIAKNLLFLAAVAAQQVAQDAYDSCLINPGGPPGTEDPMNPPS